MENYNLIPENKPLIPTVNIDLGDGLLLWIHCNKCGELYMKKEAAFYLLACHHITCVNCAPPNMAHPEKRGVSAHNCYICQKNVIGCKIGNDMPKNYKDLFHPHPSHSNLPTLQVVEFQRKHQKAFTARLMKAHRYVIESESNNKEAKAKSLENLNQLKHTRRERQQLEHQAKIVSEQLKKEEEERKKRLKLAQQIQTIDDSDADCFVLEREALHGPRRGATPRPSQRARPGQFSQRNRLSQSITSFGQHENTFDL